MTASELLEEFQTASRRGDIDGQIAALDGLLSLAQREGNKRMEVTVLRGLGNCCQDKGELSRAHSYRLLALQLMDAPDADCSLRERMAVEGDLGRSYIVASDWPRAEKHTQNAIALAQELRDEHSRLVFEINLGWIWAQTQRRHEAVELAEKVLREAETCGDDYLRALQYQNLASIFLDEHRLNDSERHARLAIAHADKAGKPVIRMQAVTLIGMSCREAYLLTGQRRYADDAMAHLRDAADQARRLRDPVVEKDAEFALAELAEDLSQLREAADHYQRALDLFEDIRSGLGYEEFQTTFFESVQPRYDHVTELLLRQGDLAGAFETTEKIRSRLLLASLGLGRSNAFSWHAADRARLDTILDDFGQAVLRQCAGDRRQGSLRDITVGGRPSTGAVAVSDHPALSAARSQFLQLYESQRLHRANWDPARAARVAGISEAQNFLGPNDALLDYYVAANSLVIFVATRDTAHFQHLAYPADRLRRDVDAVAQAMREMENCAIASDVSTSEQPLPGPAGLIQAQLDHALEKLFAILVAPVLAVTAEKSHWLIVPHGPLHRLPWAALRGAGKYLLEQHTISLLPSVSTLRPLLHRQPRPSAQAIFFADPDPVGCLRLPGAQREVEAGYSRFRNGPPPFLGPAATKAEFLRHAPGASVLHLACHHLFDATAPLLSFLKLAGCRGSDFLYAFEAADLDLHADLVVLSACQSAHSRIGTGDEQVGIVRAFLAAGANTVISTLWAIEDESAADFFKAFYSPAVQTGIADALALAQRRLLSDPRYSSPYFWAPYVLTGRWDQRLTITLAPSEICDPAPGGTMGQSLTSVPPTR